MVKKVRYVHMEQSGICDFAGLTVSPLILAPGIARGTAGPTTAARFFKAFVLMPIVKTREKKKIKINRRT